MMKKTIKVLSGLALTAMLQAQAPAEYTPAATAEKSGLLRWMEGDYLLGDWGGARKRMSERGVDLEAVYFGALPVNFQGGIRSGSVYQGLLLMTLDVDTEKSFGWHGGRFHAGSIYTHGSRFSPVYTGDFNVASLIDFAHMFRLWELTYEQTFWNDKFSFKFGQMAIDRDFILPEYYNTLASINFLNQTFFYPTLAFNVYDVAGLPRGNHALGSTPFGVPGARLRYDVTPSVYVQAAVYDGNPDFSHSGTRVRLSADEGALSYFEAGVRVNQGKESKGLPGVYKVGGYFHTDDFIDNKTFFSTGTVENHSGNWGAYFLADQMLTLEQGHEDPARQGLIGFLRGAIAPADRNISDYGIDGGLVYRGAIPTRNWDTLGVAYSYLNIASGIREGFQAMGAPVIPDYEAVLEISYKAQIAAWWTLQPSLQWLQHPGGSKANADAFVLVLQTTLRF